MDEREKEKKKKMGKKRKRKVPNEYYVWRVYSFVFLS